MPGYARPPQYIANNITFTPGGNIEATNVQDAIIEVDSEGGAGAVGGGTDEAFYENDITITESYTITQNRNAMTAGPISVNDGVTISVPDGSTWVIV